MAANRHINDPSPIFELAVNESQILLFNLSSLELVGQELMDLLLVLGHSDVTLEKTASLVKCACGYEGPAEVYQRNHLATRFRCPKCEALPEVVKGEELEFELGRV